MTLRSDHNPYTDRNTYSASCQECINFIISPQGGIILREGFERHNETAAPTDKNRLFQLRRGGLLSDVLVDVTNDGFVHYWVEGVEEPSVDADNTHLFLLSEFDDVYFSNRRKTGVLVHADHPPLYVKQNYLGEITTDELTNTQIPLVHFHDDKSPSRPTNVNTRDFTLSFTGTWTQGDPYSIIYGAKGALIGGELVNFPMGLFFFSTEAKNIEELEFVLKTNYFLDSPETTVSVVAIDIHNYTITITGKNSTYRMTASPSTQPPIVGQDVAATTTFEELEDATEPAWSFPYTIEETETPGDGLLHYYSVLQSHQADTDSHPVTGVDKLLYWTDLGTTKPAYYDWQHPGGNGWVDEAYYSPWDRGFPTVAVFFQQRLLLMSTKDAGTGLWGSRIGDYEYFHLGADDNEAFYYDIDTSDSPEIKWAAAQRTLIFGTSSGDYSIAADVTLTPSDITASRQNAARSHHTPAITINNEVIYVELGKEKIRSTSYVRDIQANISRDISLAAENLFRPSVKRVVVMQTPEVLIFALLDDGNIVCASYSQEENMGAWYNFDSQNFIEDIAVCYNVTTDEDELWVTVLSNGKYYIESMPYPNRNLQAKIEDADPTLLDQGIVHLDGWTTGSIVVGDNNVITGLDQYEGQTIACMVDDAWTGEYTVVNGAIVLDSADIDEKYEGGWAVGFLQTGRAKTFEVEQGNPRGTGFGTHRSWSSLTTRLLDSTLPIINGQLPPDRTPEALMGVAETVRMGLQDVEVTNLDFGDGSITIEQDRPYPTHVLGMFGEFNVNNG